MQEACVLYMQLDKASTVAGIAKMLEEKKGNGLYHYIANALIQLRCKFMLLSRVQ
jgi:hypothetical protein